MKLQVLVGFIISFSVLCHGQIERKRKVNYSEFFMRTYYFLKENESIRDGPYKLSIQGTTVVEGQYAKSKKTGIWTFSNSLGQELYQYDFSSDSLINWNKGKFDAVKWEFATSRQFLQDFNSVSLAPYIDFYSQEFIVYRGADTIQSVLDRPPLLLDSYLRFQLELFDILRANVPDFHVNSKSLIRFIVDAHGDTKDFKILASTGLNFEREFVSQVKLKNLKWIPGKLGNDYVDTEITLPIIIHTDYQDNKYVRSNIVFTDLAFISHFKKLKYKKDFKHVDNWKYVIYD